MTQPLKPKNYQKRNRYFLLNEHANFGGHGLIPWCWHMTFQHANGANQRSLSVVDDQTGESRFSNWPKPQWISNYVYWKFSRKRVKRSTRRNRVSPSTIEAIWEISTYTSQNISINPRWPGNQEARHNLEKTQISKGCNSRDPATSIKMIGDKTYSVP